MANSVILTAAGVVKQQGSIAKFYGFHAITATATADISLRDGGSAGTVRFVIASGTAKGTTVALTEPIVFNDGIYADYSTATGTVNFLAA